MLYPLGCLKKIKASSQLIIYLALKFFNGSCCVFKGKIFFFAGKPIAHRDRKQVTVAENN